MPVTTPVYLVASPRRGVGKTLIARLLTEFFISEDRYVEAFDLNVSAPSLIDYLPGCTAPATLADTPGQMALFDRLVRNDRTPKVVDLGVDAFERFFSIAARIGFFEESHCQTVRIVVMFVAAPDAESV